MWEGFVQSVDGHKRKKNRFPQREGALPPHCLQTEDYIISSPLGLQSAGLLCDFTLTPPQSPLKKNQIEDR